MAIPNVFRQPRIPSEVPRVRQMLRRLSRRQRSLGINLITKFWNESNRNEEEAVAAFQAHLNENAKEYNIDPATIILLVQLAILIYKALVYLEVLGPVSPGLVTLVAGETE